MTMKKETGTKEEKPEEPEQGSLLVKNRQKKGLAIFHHKSHNNGMKVVEKDKIVSGMLRDERSRSEEMLAGLRKSLADLPKGVLSERKKRYKKKAYSYFSLKYREGEKVVNQHVRMEQVPALRKQLDQRKKIEKEMKFCRKRIAYLSKILKVAKR